ncbi:MAG: glycosyltransferase family 1 protein [Bacteroidia bacterium]|jgi:glycosyltransferase involved in cell wall biosynthesis
MRIGVNVRLLIKNRIDGISRFSFETLKRITTNHPEHTFVFFFDRRYSDEFIFSSNIRPVVVPPQTRRPFLNEIWTGYTLPMAMKKHPLDLFLSMDGLLPLSTKVPCLPVIHDLNFEHHPEWLPNYAVKYYQKRYPQFAAKAKRIITVSEFSRHDIATRYGIPLERIDVVYNGVSDRFHSLHADEQQRIRNRFSNGVRYMLFVGSLHPRKNILKTLLAFDAYRSQTNAICKLVIAGEKYFGNHEMEQVYNQMQFREDVIFTGTVSDDDLIQLYAAAQTFVFASLFEGFGIPVLESMKSGCPVIASNTTSLPEVCGDAAILVNPDDPQEITRAMIEMDQEQIRDKYINLGVRRAAHFTWDQSAALLWKSIEQTKQT